jgi:AraC-like DNA-binding protein
MPAHQENPSYTSAVLSGPISGMLDLDWRQVLAQACIAAADSHDRRFLVSAGEYLRLWDAMMDLSGQSDVSRLLGLRMAGGPAIPVLFAMTTAPDFETGVSRMAAFKSLFGPMRFVLTPTRTEYRVEVAPDVSCVELPASFSSPQIIYLHATAKALARHRIAPLKVALPLPREERERLADVFGQVPALGDPSLIYSRADARTPFVSNNPELWRATEADLLSQAMIQSKGLPLADRVRATILEALSITEPTIDHVCDRLVLSRSTLLRGLSREGASFQQLLDETRKDLAIRYLVKSELNNQQIAHLVGYRDPNAFQRAFRKWTGMTPRQVRADRSA